MMSGPCPDRDRLTSYTLGMLDAETAVALEPHVAQCVPCQDLLQAIEGESDELLAALRGVRNAAAVEAAPREIRLVRSIADPRFLATTRLEASRPRRAARPGRPVEPRPHTRPPIVGPMAAEAVGRLPASAGDLAGCIRAIGLIGEADVARLESQFALESEAGDAMSFARWLLERAELTAFQVGALCRGRAVELLLDDYVLVDEVGQGGMGRVYRAHHIRMGRDAAIKILAEHLFDDPATAERFGREIRAIASLSHPNVVAAYDAREYGRTQYLVMEFIEGATLASVVQRGGPLGIAEASTVTRQAALGLLAAHQKGIIHRDMKPANLLVTCDGQVKVSDLGLARIELPTEADDDLTETGQILGTPDYISPEQTRNVADERSDIYSLGWTMYFLLTGRTPFEGQTRLGKLMAHRDAKRPSLRDVRADVPRDLDRLFRQMVAQRPDDRPKSMKDVVERLEDFSNAEWAVTPELLERPKKPQLDEFFRELEVETTEARRQQAASRAAAKRKRRRRAVLAASLLLPLLVVVAFGLHTLTVRANTAEGDVVVRVHGIDPAKLDIRVQQGDRDVTILDAKRGWSVRLPKGTYAFSIGRGDERFKLDRQVVEVAPNGKQFIEVQIRPGRSSPAVDEPMPGDGSRLYGELARVDVCDRCLSMVLSPDAQTAYILGDDGLIHVVDIDKRQVTRRINGEQAASLTLSHDGRKIATTGGGDATIRVWDVASGKQLAHRRQPVPPRLVEFSADDQILFVTSWAPPGKATFPLTGDGEDAYRSLMRFRVETMAPLAPITDERRTVYSALGLSPDGEVVATGDDKGAVVLRNATTGAQLQTFGGLRGPIHAVRFSSDSQRVFASGLANRLLCRQVVDGEQVFARVFRYGFSGSDFGPDETLFVLAGRPELRVFDRRRHPAAARIDILGHRQSIRDVKFLSDDRHAVSASLDGTMRIWKLPPRPPSLSQAP